MKYKHLKYLLSVLFLAVPFMANANLIWPSLYIVQQYYCWYIILAGLIIETVSCHIFAKATWKKSFIMMLTTNAISAIVGVLAIPISGIAVEILTIPLAPFNVGTFDLSHWILDYILAVLTNTCIEDWALQRIFKLQFKSNFWWLFGANAISVIISIFISLSLT